MTDKEKQIEEMADCDNCIHKDVCYIHESYNDCAEEVKETGCFKYHRKIPEGSVVMSKEEYQNDFNSQFNKGYERGSKETAREIFNKIKIKVLTEDMTEDRPQTLYRFTSFDIMKMAREIVEELGVAFENGHAIVEVKE